MKVTPIEFHIEDYVWSVADGDHSRSEGVHVSGIIRDIENRVILPGQRRDDKHMSKDELRRMGKYRTMGFIWELIVEAILRVWMTTDRAHIVRQTELEKDGVYLSPDAFDTQEWCLEEYKATWRSMRRLEDLEGNFWSWLVQMKAYCYALGCNKARLYVFFVNGDYRESGPDSKCLLLEWSDQELEENWQMLLGHRDKMLRRPAGEKLPPVPKGIIEILPASVVKLMGGKKRART